MLFEGMGAAQGLVTSSQTWSIPYSVRYMVACALADTVIAYGVADMIARALAYPRPVVHPSTGATSIVGRFAGAEEHQGEKYVK